MENMKEEPMIVIGQKMVSLGFLPIQLKQRVPMEIIANSKQIIPKNKDGELKYDYKRQERTITFKFDQKKSFSSLVDQLTMKQQGYMKKFQKITGVLKIDEEGKGTFNFCKQRRYFKRDLYLPETKHDIYKMQQESQLRMMDGRRKNQSVLIKHSGRLQSDREQKYIVKFDKINKKRINSDEEDDPYSGDDSC